ncbi:MAG: NAD(P)H-dependent oxidoreductase [Proteobacteria bacterium]|nr:NAD(P)H-dependent oxidoreductase [Pseudomonadota bacterium]
MRRIVRDISHWIFIIPSRVVRSNSQSAALSLDGCLWHDVSLHGQYEDKIGAIVSKLVGISGSLRQGSFNTALLRAASELVPPGIELTVNTIRGIPLYDGDIEANDGIPEAVDALKEMIAASDGVLLVTPEYNGSIPGAFKNAIDWLSRPPNDSRRVFGGKPFGLIGASPGGLGTVLSQGAWLPVLRALGVEFWTEGRLLVSRAQTAFSPDGVLTDEAVRRQLGDFVRGFASFADSHRRMRANGADARL